MAVRLGETCRPNKVQTVCAIILVTLEMSRVVFVCGNFGCNVAFDREARRVGWDAKANVSVPCAWSGLVRYCFTTFPKIDCGWHNHLCGKKEMPDDAKAK